MEKTTLYLSSELQRSLLEMAKREGRSQADIIRSALAAYVSGRPHIGLRSVGAGSDDKVTGAGSEDWLRKNWNSEDLKKRKAAR